MLARLSHAETAVVIVVPHPGTNEAHAFEHRLRAELVAAGFQPISVEVASEITPPVIRNAAVRLMSHAALTLTVHDGIVSGLVWIEGRGKGEDSWRPVAEYPVSEQAPTVFAVRATDVLHGGLLELGYLGTAPPASEPPSAAAPGVLERDLPALSTTATRTPAPPPPAPVRSETHGPNLKRSPASGAPQRNSPPEETPPWRLNAWATLADHVLMFPTSVGLAATATRRIHAHWQLGGAMGYFAPVTATADAGRAKLMQGYFGPRLEWIKSVTNSVDAFGYAESGVHATWVWSEAKRPFVAHSAHSLTGYSGFGLGVTWSPLGTVGLSAATGFLVPWKRADVVIADAVVAQAAGLTLLINAGLSLQY